MVRIEFGTENAAFEQNYPQEVARILREISARIADGVEAGGIRDTNGNTVGSWAATPEDPR